MQIYECIQSCYACNSRYTALKISSLFFLLLIESHEMKMFSNHSITKESSQNFISFFQKLPFFSFCLPFFDLFWILIEKVFGHSKYLCLLIIYLVINDDCYYCAVIQKHDNLLVIYFTLFSTYSLQIPVNHFLTVKSNIIKLSLS